MPPRWSCACAPARAVDRGVAEHCRPFDPRPHAPDWLAPPQSGHSPRTDSPRPCEQSAPQLSCQPAASLGFDASSHRTCARRAFDTRPEWYPAGPHSPLRRVPFAAQSTANLGQIGRGDMVPEFEQALFRLGPTGILPEVIKTRYGFHLVAVDQRIPGETLPFEVVREQIAELLKASVEERALRQYVSILAGQAELTGVDLQTVDSPLVQ